MPSISGPRSAPVVTSTSSTSQAKPASTPAQAPAADGYGTQSSFATAAPAAPTSTPPKAITEAKTQLDKFDASAAKDAIALVLNKPFPLPKELKAANEALQKLAENAPDGMTDAEFKKIQNGIGYKENQNTMMGMVTSNLQKMIEEIKKRGESKD